MSKHVELLEAAGIDPVALATKLNLMYLLIDMADGYACEVENMLKKTGLYRNSDKQEIKAVRHHAGRLVSGVSKTLGNDALAEGFGELSDFLKQVIELSCHAKDDQRIKVISSIKPLIK